MPSTISAFLATVHQSLINGHICTPISACCFLLSAFALLQLEAPHLQPRGGCQSPLLGVTGPELVQARKQMQAPRGGHMQEVRASGFRRQRGLGAQFVRGFDHGLSAQIALPAQPGVCALPRPQRFPSHLTVRVCPALAQSPLFVPAIWKPSGVFRKARR